MSPPASITLAVLAALFIAWYWRQLGRPDVPPSRRKIRRASLVVMLFSLPAFVRGLSYLDPRLDREKYVIAWTLALTLMLVVIVIAVLDALNSFRLHQRQRHETIQKAATELGRAIVERRERAAQAGRAEKHDAASGERKA